MGIGWFICPYKLKPANSRARYCAMDDFTAQITADGGRWSETEILGDRAIVKVNASASTLSTIAGTPSFRRIPLDQLDAPLASLTAGQKLALRQEVLDAGYTQQEVDGLTAVTLGDVLRFMASRRLKPRYDIASKTILVDGQVIACKSVDSVDAEVS